MLAVVFMENSDILKHIEKRKNERKLHLMCWEYIEKLNADVGLSDSTMKELQAKVSSKIAMCDRSIQDHERLL